MRVGKLTGTIYNDLYTPKDIPECCHYLGDASVEECLNFRDMMKTKDLAECLTCLGCPAAKKMNHVYNTEGI